MALWYVVVRLEKYLNYLTGFGMILWYIELELEKHLEQLAGVSLVLLQPSIDAARKACYAVRKIC